MKHKVTMTLNTANYRLLVAASELKGSASPNIWAAILVVDHSLQVLRDLAGVNKHAKAVLAAYGSPPDATVEAQEERRGDDTTSSIIATMPELAPDPREEFFQSLFARINDLKGDHNASARADHVATQEEEFPGFADWYKRHSDETGNG